MQEKHPEDSSIPSPGSNEKNGDDKRQLKVDDKERENLNPAVDSNHVAQDAAAPQPELPDQKPTEHGGQAGPEPTRFGDWEKKGRCTDF